MNLDNKLNEFVYWTWTKYFGIKTPEKSLMKKVQNKKKAFVKSLGKVIRFLIKDYSYAFYLRTLFVTENRTFQMLF